MESVWDYPRPPILERTSRRIRIIFAGETIADSTGAWRLLETSHPPTYYIPPGDVRKDLLAPASGASFCEFKGSAAYWSVCAGGRVAEKAAWSYKDPAKGFEQIRDHYAFYAGRVDECFVDDERAQPQAGGFYGGWITADLQGPFKGGPGTGGW